MSADYIEMDGYRFIKDKKTGYYLSTTKINGKRERLHRYVWEKHYCPIPDGYAVHHIDHNKLNNDPENLKMVSDYKHRSIHNLILQNTEERRRKFAIVRQMGSDAHKRPEERVKQKLRSTEQWVERKKQDPKIMICEVCGDEYETYHLGETMFCSRKCKARDFRRRFREEHGYGYDRKIRPGRKKEKDIARDTG